MESLATPSFILIVITSMTILTFRDWRINAGALALQYLAAFIMVTLSWPIGMAVTKLIVGWMAAASLALTLLRQNHPHSASETTASLIFRGLAGIVTIIVIFVLSPRLGARVFPGLDLIIIQGGLILMGMALMQLGTYANPYLTIISLLSLISGFEVIHAGLERSILLTGLLAVTNLGLALVGVYFIARKNPDEDQDEQEEPLK